MTAYDELELDTLGDRKTALFLIMSDTEDSMNFLIAMATPSFSTCCVRRRMMCMAAGCRSMCAAS